MVIDSVGKFSLPKTNTGLVLVTIDTALCGSGYQITVYNIYPTENGNKYLCSTLLIIR